MIVCHCENLKTVVYGIFDLENIGFKVRTSHLKAEIVLNLITQEIKPIIVNGFLLSLLL
jgi:hypothetical protein